jgi:hypothetical protein
LADIRNYPPENYAGTVILTLPDTADRDFILNLIRSFLTETAIVEALSGRLAIVEPGRIRLRPPIKPR